MAIDNENNTLESYPFDEETREFLLRVKTGNIGYNQWEYILDMKIQNTETLLKEMIETGEIKSYDSAVEEAIKDMIEIEKNILDFLRGNIK